MSYINSFRGRYVFMSNFYPCKIEHKGITYPSVEHYYVALKVTGMQFIDGVYLQQPNKTTSVQSMWYSIKMANHLKTEYEKAHNFKYDVVIRSRMDVIIHALSLDRLTETGCVYTDCVGENMDFPNDQFAVSDSASSDYYSSLYDNLTSYKDEGFTWFVGERLLKYHMAKTNIKSCYTPFISNNIFKTI